MKSIIKWNIVNLRSKNKNLPKENKYFVFLNSTVDFDKKYKKDNDGITTGKMFSRTNSDRKTTYYLEGYITRPQIKSGFAWCYLENIITEQS